MNVLNAPVVWVLLSPRAGDNTQLLALANRLAAGFIAKRFVFHGLESPFRIVLGATLKGLAHGAGNALNGTAPDVLLVAGRPNEAVAFWIKHHLNPDVKIVYVGSPWADFAKFDLVITTPQYRLPRLPNILQNDLPLHDVLPERLAEAASQWSEEIDRLPKPRTALLVGGRSGPYLFGPQSAARLATLASARANAQGGSLLVTTSARTLPAATKALFEAIAVPSHRFAWRPDTPNPFHAYLGLADEFVVTADSVSMLTEACATGKPVFLFDTETGRRSMRAEENRMEKTGKMPPPHWLGADLASTLWRLGLKFGPDWWTRDIRIVHRNLVKAGRAAWFGEEFPSGNVLDGSRDMENALERIRDLVPSLR